MHTHFWSISLKDKAGCRWGDNIKIKLTEVKWQVVDWMHLSEDQEQWWAFVNTVMNLRIPEEAVHFLTNRASEEGLGGVNVNDKHPRGPSIAHVSCLIGFPSLCTQ